MAMFEKPTRPTVKASKISWRHHLKNEPQRYKNAPVGLFSETHAASRESAQNGQGAPGGENEPRRRRKKNAPGIIFGTLCPQKELGLSIMSEFVHEDESKLNQMIALCCELHEHSILFAHEV